MHYVIQKDGARDLVLPPLGSGVQTIPSRWQHWEPGISGNAIPMTSFAINDSDWPGQHSVICLRPFLLILLPRPSGSERYAILLWLIRKNSRIAKPPWRVGDLYEGSLLLGGCRQSSGHAASNHRCGGFMHMAMGTLTVIQSRRNAPSGQTGNLVHIVHSAVQTFFPSTLRNVHLVYETEINAVLIPRKL